MEAWLVQVLGADGLLYQSIDDLLAVAQSLNPDIQRFEASCFTGKPPPPPQPPQAFMPAGGRKKSCSKRLKLFCMFTNAVCGPCLLLVNLAGWG